MDNLNCLKIHSNIKFIIEIDDIKLPSKIAINCGLITNELVTNALKYAFTDNKSGIIQIMVKKIKSNTLKLIVRDDGVGLPKGFNFINNKHLGLTLVRLLSDDLSGELNISGDNCTEVSVIFKS